MKIEKEFQRKYGMFRLLQCMAYCWNGVCLSSHPINTRRKRNQEANLRWHITVQMVIRFSQLFIWWNIFITQLSFSIQNLCIFMLHLTKWLLRDKNLTLLASLMIQVKKKSINEKKPSSSFKQEEPSKIKNERMD
jgi:hypothetical protein